MTLSTKVLVSLAVGIGVGVFFGEMVGFLATVGNIFIQLLQMTVLPYVVLSLIVGLGRLNYQDALLLAKKCSVLLLLLWALTLAGVLLMPMAFPNWTSASFFSTALIEEQPPFDFLELYIPANPFFALANNLVPAVVVFSIAVGVAFIGIPNKETLLEPMSILVDVLLRITNFVVELSPIGIFAIAASAAGTMNMEEIGRWQVYLVTYIVVWGVLSFWVLPALVTSVSPLTYRDVVGFTKDALITAFATGNLLVVLPILAEKSKELLKKCGLSAQQVGPAVNVIVPSSFTIPNAGKLLTLSFVLFAGWFSNSPVSVDQYIEFASAGFFSFFGSVPVAIPFLLDLLRIPADLFQLYIVSDVLISRFGTMLAAMHTLVLALLGPLAMAGKLSLRWKTMIRYSIVTVGLTVGGIWLVGLLFAYLPEPDYTKYNQFMLMNLLEKEVTSVVHESLPPTPTFEHSKHPSRLTVIHDRGSLRSCYFKDSLPFAFRNSTGNLVGFGIDISHTLAKDLNVTLEIVKIERDNTAEHLKQGICDFIASGIPITTEAAQEIAFSIPYMNMTLAFIVKDHRREEFSSWESIRSLETPQIAIVNIPYYVTLVQEYLPNAKIKLIPTARSFFVKQGEGLDAMVHAAEAGSAWTLVYPEYTVAVPRPDSVAIPVAYPVAHGDEEMLGFLNSWLELKKKDKTVEKLFAHWIMGKSVDTVEPRWSIIRNVLHWVD